MNNEIKNSAAFNKNIDSNELVVHNIDMFMHRLGDVIFRKGIERCDLEIKDSSRAVVSTYSFPNISGIRVNNANSPEIEPTGIYFEVDCNEHTERLVNLKDINYFSIVYQDVSNVRYVTVIVTKKK